MPSSASNRSLSHQMTEGRLNHEKSPKRGDECGTYARPARKAIAYQLSDETHTTKIPDEKELNIPTSEDKAEGCRCQTHYTSSQCSCGLPGREVVMLQLK